jgi:hypothetical protein
MEVGLVSAPLAFARTEASAMRGNTKELWEQFCEQAAVEQDPEKLVQLAKESKEEVEARLMCRAFNRQSLALFNFFPPTRRPSWHW